MEPCPFCKQPLPTAIVVDGGMCPKCLTEVPGEESPTDPGGPPAPARRSRVWWGLLGGAGVVLAAGVGVAAMLALEPAVRPAEIRTLVLEDVPMPDVVSATEGTVPASVSEGRAAQQAPARAAPRHRPAPAAEARSAVAPAPSPKPAPARVADGRPAPPPLPLLDLDLGLTTAARPREGADAAAVRRMLRRQLKAGIPELAQCYDRRLKQRPSLRGRWTVSFTVDRGGQPVDAAAEGLDMSDEELEGCLTRHIESHWRFGAVPEPSVVRKTLTFALPGG